MYGSEDVKFGRLEAAGGEILDPQVCQLFMQSCIRCVHSRSHEAASLGLQGCSAGLQAQSPQNRR